jgi:hypothetical protein
MAMGIAAAARAKAAGLAALCAAAALAGCAGNDAPPATPAVSPPAGEMLLPAKEPVILYAPDTGDQAGAVAAGDFNGDGVPDVVLAAAFADGPQNQREDAGELYVFLGPFEPGERRDTATGGADAIIYGAAPGDQAGRSLTAADANGDGTDDVIIGSPFAGGPDGGREDAGRVDVVFGRTGLGADVRTVDLAEGSGLRIHGRAAGSFAGFSVATGRLNGDQAADLVIGAFYGGGPAGDRPLAGEVYVVFGGPGMAGEIDTAAGEQDIIVFGAQDGDRLGEGVAAGDVDGDGTDDLVLPAPFAVNQAGERDAGRTYVILSPLPEAIDLRTAAVYATIEGADNGDQLGHVTAAGDVDGDGRADILLTAVSADGPDNEIDLAGEAALVFSSSLMPTVLAGQGHADVLIYGPAAQARLGRSAAMGDLNGDGRRELILGAPGAAGPGGTQGQAGQLYVIPHTMLRPEMFMPREALVYFGRDPGDSLASGVFGRNPVYTADMNGDGRDEILVVAPLAGGPGNSRPGSGEAYILFITSLSDDQSMDARTRAYVSSGQ